MRMVPTKVNATEQAPCSESALNAMEMARILLPVQNMKAIMNMTPTNSRPMGP